MLPKFIVIGAMKGGTTSLFHYLSAHQELVPPSIKETDFFCAEKNFSKGISWYESLFTGEGIRFEASPNYTKRHLFSGVPERIYEVIPDAKLIYVMRDPVARLVSNFVHNLSQGREERNFDEIISDVESGYFKTGMYFFQLEAYLEYFKAENILILDSAELRNNTVATMLNVFQFLNLPPIDNAEVLTKSFHLSKVKQRKSKLERRICQLTTNRRLLQINQRLLRSFRSDITTPQLTSQQRTRLASVFKEDVEKLRKFSGMRFESWDS